MIDAFQTATSGMSAAAARLGSAAQCVAEAGTGSVSAPEQGTQVGTGTAAEAGAALPPAASFDLSATALDLIAAGASFAMNAAVARTADRMAGHLIDVAA